MAFVAYCIREPRFRRATRYFPVTPHIVPERRIVARHSAARYIVFMQGQAAAPTVLYALVLSMLVFKPSWQARVQLGPRSAAVAVAAILLLIGAIDFAGITYR